MMVVVGGAWLCVSACGWASFLSVVGAPTVAR